MRNPIRIIAFLVLVLRFTALAQTPVPATLRTAIEKIDAMAAAELAKDDLGSVTVGVVSGPNLVWTKSYGLADMEKKIPATKDSVYRIGSITKQFTGLMFLQLVQDGKVKLTDPVEKYFPDINKVQGRHANAPPITLLQLSTMTSGLDREPANPATYLKGPVSEWEKVLISALPETKYAYEPDTHYFYSNIGYAILGAALSRAAAVPYTDYVQQRIFAPLEMAHSSFEPNPTIKPNLSKGYEVGRDGKVVSDIPMREHAGRGYKVPNGAMYTTVGDLARFVSFELGEGPDIVLKRDILEDNYKRTNSANGDLTMGYGAGFMLQRKGDLIAIGHGGSVAGYRAEAYVNRANKTGVIVLRNVGGGKFNLADLCFRALTELR